MIKQTNISKIYKGVSIPVVALDNVNLELEQKGLTFILGKSGSGKSTLLNIIGLLDEPTSGNVSYVNNEYSRLKDTEKDYIRNEEIGFVFQNFNLINEFSVYDNLAIVLDLQDAKEKEARINEILKLVELEGYEKRFPQELSAGQQQRVSIARALIKNPKVILADEPTGNVDSKTAKVVLDLFKKISKDMLVVIVSHNESDSIKYSDRLIELADGKIIRDLKRVDGYLNDLVINDKQVILPNNRTLTNDELKELNKQKLDDKEIIQNSSGFIDSVIENNNNRKLSFEKKKMNNTFIYSSKLYKNRLITNILSTFILGFIVSVIIIATLFFRFDMSDKYETAIKDNKNPTVLLNENNDRLNNNKNEDFLPIESRVINELKGKGDKVYPVYNISGTLHDGKFPKPTVDPFGSIMFGTAVVDESYLIELFGNENGELELLFNEMNTPDSVMVTDYYIYAFSVRNKLSLLNSPLIVKQRLESQYPVKIGAVIKTDFFDKYGEYILEDEFFNVDELNVDELNDLMDSVFYKYSLRYTTNPNFIDEYVNNFHQNFIKNGNKYTDFRIKKSTITGDAGVFTQDNIMLRYWKEDGYEANHAVLTLAQFNKVFGTDYKHHTEVDMNIYKDKEVEIELVYIENDNRYVYKDTFKLLRLAILEVDSVIYLSTQNTESLKMIINHMH